MFEDITDPPPPRETSKMLSWPVPWYPSPEDSVEASWNTRVGSGLAFIGVAIDIVGRYRKSDLSLLLVDAGLLALLALVWIFRSPVAAGLACATALFFLLPFGGPEASGRVATRGWVVFAPFIVGLLVTRDCFRYQRFRKDEEAPPSADSADSLRPV